MAKPSLTKALTWPKYENAVLAVFEESLRRFAASAPLPKAEVPINFRLLKIALDVHHEQLNARMSIPFVIDIDPTNQPVLNDVYNSRRLQKRPDFTCSLTNPNAADGASSQIRYSLECKRLGIREAGWVFNENYSENGVLRFVNEEHSYAKGCSSATMIGYVQNMEPDALLTEVNQFAAIRNLPSLRVAASGWAEKNVTRLSQDPITRRFDDNPVSLGHLWMDLRHCSFEVTSKPAEKADKKPPRTAKKAAKKSSK